MITAITRADAHLITNFDEQVFDLNAAYVEWVQTEPQDNRQGVFHPSASDGCSRHGVYEFIGTPRVYQTAIIEDPSGNAAKDVNPVKDRDTFRVGHAVHEFTQYIIGDLARILTPKGIEFKFEAEVPYDKATDILFLDFGIGGTTDGILEIWHPQQGWHQRGVIEIKTSKTEKFDELKEPKPGHQMQANIYAFRFDVPIIWYWYFNKNTSDRKVFRRQAEDKWLEPALNKFEGMGTHVKNGTLPDREESWWMCPRCEYSHVCNPEINKRIDRQKAIIQMGKKGGFGNR